MRRTEARGLKIFLGGPGYLYFDPWKFHEVATHFTFCSKLDPQIPNYMKKQKYEKTNLRKNKPMNKRTYKKTNLQKNKLMKLQTYVLPPVPLPLTLPQSLTL